MSGLPTAAFRAVGRDDAIPDGFVVPFYLSDRKLRIAVARAGGQLYAFDDLCTCPGASCPLSGGLLTGTTIMCHCHGSEFDVTTGAVVPGPATRPLSVYEVQVADGSLRIRAKAAGRSGPRSSSAVRSSRREPKPSLMKILRRCHSTVRTDSPGA